MGISFTVMFLAALTFWWAIYLFTRQLINWIEKKMYPRIHFKLTERYRREFQ